MQFLSIFPTGLSSKLTPQKSLWSGFFAVLRQEFLSNACYNNHFLDVVFAARAHSIVFRDIPRFVYLRALLDCVFKTVNLKTPLISIFRFVAFEL